MRKYTFYIYLCAYGLAALAFFLCIAFVFLTMREGECLFDPPSPPTKSALVPDSPTYDERPPEPLHLTDPQDVSASVAGGEDVCRICLEPESLGNELIHPCKCMGTVRSIHEECLKAWLASQSEDMDQAKCELCKTPFSMKMKLSRRCSPRDACSDGFTQCLFAPLLLAVLGMLILIVYLLSDKYLVHADSSEQRSYTAALIVTCLISALVIAYLLVRSLREACCSRKLTEWRILNYEHLEAEMERVVPETKSAGEHSTFPTRLDIRPLEFPPEEEKEPVPPIMVLPKRIKIHGVKGRTPQVQSSSLTPVSQRGRLVAVTPRLFAFPASLSQSRASLNPTPKGHLVVHPGFATPTVVPGMAMRWTPDGTMERGGRMLEMMSDSRFQVAKERV